MGLLHKHISAWCISSMLLPGCLIPSRYFMRKNVFILQPHARPREALTALAPQHPSVTVWIHGTRFFYHRFYQQGIPYHEGLLKTEGATLPYKLKTIGTTLCKTDPTRFNPSHFYIFGWSGKLCFIEREKAAANLYRELSDLVKSYEQTHNYTPYIRIIAHSHGGNVALNLALQPQEPSLIIDELILLACPVQEKTKYLVENPMFKKIYALSSALDIIQIIDPQGMYKHRGKPNTFFSKRNFPHREGLAQMKVKVDRRAITHFEFTQRPFLRLLPNILTGIDIWHNDIMYKEDPNKIHKVLCVYTKKPKSKTAVITL